VSEQHVIQETPAPRTRQSLARGLGALGIEAGMTLEVHSSLSKPGWVSGGPVAVVQARRLADRETLYAHWQQEMQVRQQMAANAGYAIYRDYRWQQLFRFDYTPEDCKNFHQAVEQVIVPAASKSWADGASSSASRRSAPAIPRPIPAHRADRAILLTWARPCGSVPPSLHSSIPSWAPTSRS
jgi:hypothetical protein